MKDTKLFLLLETFNSYQLNRFNKFLHSPYHNEDSQLISLFNQLLPYFKNPAKATLPSPSELWKAIYGKQKFKNLKFARLFSDLLKKAEDFLVIDTLKHNEPVKLENLLNQYTEKKLFKHYPEAAQLARKKLEATPYREGEYYLQLFRLEAHQTNFIELLNQRTTEKNLLQTSEALDAFYLINKLNYLAAILHYKKFLSMEGEVKLATEVIEHVKNNDYRHIPALQVHVKVVQSLIEPENEEHFIQLKALLAAQYKLFPRQQGRNLYAFAINYSIRKVNGGNLAYVPELLAIYRQMLVAGLMFDDADALSQFDYKNIVSVALRAGEITWVEKFIHDYKNSIPKASRQNAFTFNLAKLYFAKRQYDKVLPLLQDVVYNDIFYQLDSKTTLMKTYYELGEYMPMMALKESFRILLRRKKLISAQNRINYTNFMRFTMQLYRIDVKDTKKLQQLGKSITTSTNVADKGWLLEKLEELN